MNGLAEELRAAAEVVELFAPAFVGALVVALACALIGVHVAARRLLLVGVALPQVAAFGIALSFLFAGVAADSLLADHDAMALACELLAVAILATASRWRSVSHDTVAGVLFVGAAGLTILLMMRTAQGMDEVRNLVEGNLLALHRPEALRLGFVLGPVVLLHVVGSRRLLLCTFDREGAAALGVRTGLWETLFHLSLAVTVAAGVHATGTLFVFGYLVVPGVAGIVFARSAAGVFATAVAVALLGAGSGFVLSYLWDTPTGPMCTTTALVLLLGIAVASLFRR